MKKLIFSLAAMAFLMSSCDMGSKDSTSTITFGEYNLFENINDLAEPSFASSGIYKWNYNISKNVVDITASDIIIDNQKLSFETDTMGIKPKVFGENLVYMGFSKATNIGKGAKVTDFNGFMPVAYVPSSTNIFSSSYRFEYNTTSRLLLQYTLNDEYRVTTIWNNPCYVGQTHVTSRGNVFSTKDTGFLVQIDFAKKTADVYVLGLDLNTSSDSQDPKVLLLGSCPVTMTHSGYYIEVESPKTSVPGIVDNKTSFVETTDFAVTKFSLRMLSPDMTDVQISFLVKGKSVSFIGSSILKNAN